MRSRPTSMTFSRLRTPREISSRNASRTTLRRSLRQVPCAADRKGRQSAVMMAKAPALDRHMPSGRRWTATLLAFCGALAVVFGQTGKIQISSPAEGAYVNGPVHLGVTLTPESVARQVQQVRWFADGRQVCTVDTATVRCDWDAGETSPSTRFVWSRR